MTKIPRTYQINAIHCTDDTDRATQGWRFFVPEGHNENSPAASVLGERDGVYHVVPLGTAEPGGKTMAHSYTSCLIHYVFSTKERKKTISENFRKRLWEFMGGIARKNGMRAIAIGGTADHVHLLMSLPATVAIATAIQLIKGGSSKWVHETFSDAPGFEWQEGYGAFSISISHRGDTIAYIEKQEEHHRQVGFEEEFIRVLEKHGIEYDARYVFG